MSVEMCFWSGWEVRVTWQKNTSTQGGELSAFIMNYIREFLYRPKRSDRSNMARYDDHTILFYFLQYLQYYEYVLCWHRWIAEQISDCWL